MNLGKQLGSRLTSSYAPLFYGREQRHLEGSALYKLQSRALRWQSTSCLCSARHEDSISDEVRLLSHFPRENKTCNPSQSLGSSQDGL